VNPAAAARLAACGLPHRWQGRDRFVMLDVGSLDGRFFLAAWQAWRLDARRCRQLHVIAVGPWTTDAGTSCADVDASPALASALAAAWPPPTRNLHRLAFDDGCVQLLLAPGDVRGGLRTLIAQADAVVVEGEPAWPGGDVHGARALARLAAPQATLVANLFDPATRRHLNAAGFDVECCGLPDRPGLARHAPRFATRLDVRRLRRESGERHAVIVGAGLAGCAAAWALAEQGWSSRLLERRDTVAAEGSGNVAGLFHGSINAEDAAHARFNRAASLEAGRAARIALDEHAVAGAVDGLLQLARAPADVLAMRAQLERLGIPATWIEALDAAEASRRAGLQLERPAWFHAAGGWIDPRGLARSFLARAGTAAEVRCGSAVVALRRSGPAWELLDADARPIERASTVVLAAAGGALQLAGGRWPVVPMRGQLSLVPGALAAGWRLPRLPISGAGYLLPALEGCAVFGATTHAGDDDRAVRLDDHRRNLEQLGALVGAAATAGMVPDPAGFEGRTAWRWVSRDRLPLVGAVPRGYAALADGNARPSSRWDQPRLIERESGLFMFTALGSRGITWAALGAQVLASSITGAPMPLEAELVDAIDPARFLVRAWRRAGNGSSAAPTAPLQRAGLPSAD
jgi:tRNA 5-methylaminomethyl-2-thiouridine biosynthesis bifunctional protein